jgi:hypothetical protein
VFAAARRAANGPQSPFGRLVAITEAATGLPVSYGSIPKSSATVAEVLKQAPLDAPKAHID